jgi:hypothetical protein
MTQDGLVGLVDDLEITDATPEIVGKFLCSDGSGGENIRESGLPDPEGEYCVFGTK